MNAPADNAALNATYRKFAFTEEELAPVRRTLYSPRGPGYVMVREFLPEPIAAHLQAFWTRGEPRYWNEFEQLRNRDCYEVGQGPFASHFEGKDAYLYALWNPAPDEVTLAVALSVIQLRNQIEQQPLFRDLLPTGPMMSFYMVAVSTRADDADVKWHTDEFPHNPRFPYVEMRLQATLFLSDFGRDYAGDGMIMEDNAGNEVRVSEGLSPKAGDLLLWRYANRHCVGSIDTPDGGCGFVRVLFPLEAVRLPAPAAEPEPGQSGEPEEPSAPGPTAATAPVAAPAGSDDGRLRRLLRRAKGLLR